MGKRNGQQIKADCGCCIFVESDLYDFCSFGKYGWTYLQTANLPDGQDILLGSFFRPTDVKYTKLMDYWRKPGAGIMLLENTRKK